MVHSGWQNGTGYPLYCSKKVFTSRISSPDKYQQVVLGVQRGMYGPMVSFMRVLKPFGIDVCNVR